MDRKAIQIGIRGQAANDYVNKWIVKITDITPNVIKWRQQINNGKFKKDILPKEKIYPVSAFVRNRLNMD